MTIDLPSLLSFERKIENSDALMFSGNWAEQDKEGWRAIKIIPRLNRSTQSAYGISDDKKNQPNPVASSNDDANLPLEHDTLKVSFTLRLIGNLGLPFACNSPEFETAIKQKVDEFKQTDMLDELAKRYAYNIANGRFLWRNRVGAKNITIKVTIDRQDSEDAEVLSFNAYDYSLNNFDNADEKINRLASAIKEGLASETFIFISVEAFVELGNGQRVFPSQEMNMGEKRKVLFKIHDQAAMHNVKVGNALRTVDDWYPDAQFPIAAEPFGAVTQRGQAYRKSKTDLYTLMQAWVNDTELEDEQKAYVVANLIRGGVFSKGGD
ncbi:type I-F CRISPR-associated protein Csy3 [Psychrobacter sp. YP14]|uniref:type I-F CRISPR-associated protein Csy3 n=1 Tax=Psychrobacter sp. YP14 TaxID=2203895 RepID=UPI000D7E24CC|nr:type I-F CRISPR-associated protein Csy3 [Psychrobacter sp. YP14]AWT49256.1 type I-F CRISPR-associated protein Csy3 [Psychrobacter sp. YP14]